MAGSVAVCTSGPGTARLRDRLVALKSLQAVAEQSTGSTGMQGPKELFDDFRRLTVRVGNLGERLAARKAGRELPPSSFCLIASLAMRLPSTKRRVN